MNTQTEKMLTTSWNLVRDAGSAVSDAAVHSRVGTSLVKSLPRVKEMISVGAGLALARRGTRVAISAVRRNPLAAIAGAVALAGVGVAISVAKRRKQARLDAEAGAGSGTRPLRLTATKMPGAARAKSAPAKTSRVRKAKAKASPTAK